LALCTREAIIEQSAPRIKHPNDAFDFLLDEPCLLILELFKAQ
jgi:hypothetical protein